MEHEIHTHGQQGWQDAEPNLFLPFSPKLHFFFFYLYLQQYTPQEGALVAASARPSLWHRPSNPIILCALTKASCSQTLLLVLILPRSSHFPKQLLHPLTQRLWKISLHRYILMLNSNFIPLYRCSDARNKLNKNMFSFPGIFVRLNTQIAS